MGEIKNDSSKTNQIFSILQSAIEQLKSWRNMVNT